MHHKLEGQNKIKISNMTTLGAELISRLLLKFSLISFIILFLFVILKVCKIVILPTVSYYCKTMYILKEHS
jgi:hypothetical protein